MFKFLFLGLLNLLLLLACANERAITGGPEDKEAPEIIFASPENESVGVDPQSEILIRFNEQMDQTTFAGALEIWPRPPAGYEIKSSWTWLKVRFPEPLDSGETYLLTLGKGARDLRKNGLAKTYVLAFSTGNDLNQGRIVGKIHGSEDIRKNGDLYLYRTFDTPLDQLRSEPPDYIFQPDNEGRYNLPYLAQRGYMLFYHWDRNNNKQIDGDDYFGRPVSASVSARSDSSLTPNDIWPRLVKPDKVKLLQANALAQGLARIRVGRPVTHENLRDIELYTHVAQIPLLGRANDPEDEFAVILETAIPIAKGSDLWIRNFRDTSGYVLNSDTLQFKVPEELDTLTWTPGPVTWENGSAILKGDDDQLISIRSNLPMRVLSDSAFHIVDTSVDTLRIYGSVTEQSSLEWVFAPDTALQLGQVYEWELDSRFFHVPLNTGRPDSLLKGRLSSVAPDSLGSLRVKQMGSHILHCELMGKGFRKRFQIQPWGEILIEHLPAQTYQLSGYEDKNADGQYQSGGLGPASGAEPFWFYDEEIRIRARWETDLGIWRFKAQ